MTDIEAVNAVHRGGRATCSAAEYSTIRPALLVYAGYMSARRLTLSFNAAMSEVKRLDKVFGFDPKAEFQRGIR